MGDKEESMAEERPTEEADRMVDRRENGVGETEKQGEKVGNNSAAAFAKAQANGFSRGGSKKGAKRTTITAAKMNKILELKASGFPVTQIARAVVSSESRVRHALARYSDWMKNLEDVVHFKENRADLVAAAQLTTLKTMMREDKLEKASYNNLAYGLTQLHMFERLQREQSTQNIASKTQIITGKQQDSEPNLLI